jgi:hypothetical protein
MKSLSGRGYRFSEPRELLYIEGLSPTIAINSRTLKRLIDHSWGYKRCRF